MLTAESRRRSFPMLDEMVYLNSAAEGMPPVEVGEALAQYFRDKQLGMDGRERHFAALEETKSLVAELYGLTAAEIGICSCSSEAFNLAALAMRLREGDEVVINDLDFPAGVTPWLQPTCPATVLVWRARAGVLHVEDLVKLLTPQTRLTYRRHTSWPTGWMLTLRGEAYIDVSDADGVMYVGTMHGTVVLLPGTYAVRCALGCETIQVSVGPRGVAWLKGSTPTEWTYRPLTAGQHAELVAGLGPVKTDGEGYPSLRPW